MICYYGLFVAYIVVFERQKSGALHIEQGHHYQEADARRRAEEAAVDAVLGQSVLAHAAVPANMRQQGFAAGAEAWPSFSQNPTIADAAEDALAQMEAEGSDVADRNGKHEGSSAAAASQSEAIGATNGQRDAPSRRSLVHVHDQVRGSATSFASGEGTSAPESRRSLVRVRSPAMQQAMQSGSVQSAASESAAAEPLLGHRRSSILTDTHTTPPLASMLLQADPASAAVASCAASAALAERMSWSERVVAPLLAVLHLTMPAVGLADHVCYPKVYAVLLPVTAPLFVVVAKGLAFQRHSPLGVDAVLYGALCSAFSSAVIYAIYPRDGRHYGILSGIFTALTFGMAMVWMDIAAGVPAHMPL